MNIWNYQETLFIFSWTLAVQSIDEQVTTGLIVKLELKRGKIREKLKHFTESKTTVDSELTLFSNWNKKKKPRQKKWHLEMT